MEGENDILSASSGQLRDYLAFMSAQNDQVYTVCSQSAQPTNDVKDWTDQIMEMCRQMCLYFNS